MFNHLTDILSINSCSVSCFFSLLLFTVFFKSQFILLEKPRYYHKHFQFSYLCILDNMYANKDMSAIGH